MSPIERIEMHLKCISERAKGLNIHEGTLMDCKGIARELKELGVIDYEVNLDLVKDDLKCNGY